MTAFCQPPARVDVRARRSSTPIRAGAARRFAAAGPRRAGRRRSRPAPSSRSHSGSWRPRGSSARRRARTASSLAAAAIVTWRTFGPWRSRRARRRGRPRRSASSTTTSTCRTGQRVESCPQLGTGRVSQRITVPSGAQSCPRRGDPVERRGHARPRRSADEDVVARRVRTARSARVGRCPGRRRDGAPAGRRRSTRSSSEGRRRRRSTGARRPRAGRPRCGPRRQSGETGGADGDLRFETRRRDAQPSGTIRPPAAGARRPADPGGAAESSTRRIHRSAAAIDPGDGATVDGETAGHARPPGRRRAPGRAWRARRAARSSPAIGGARRGRPRTARSRQRSVDASSAILERRSISSARRRSSRSIRSLSPTRITPPHVGDRRQAVERSITERVDHVHVAPIRWHGCGTAPPSSATIVDVRPDPSEPTSSRLPAAWSQRRGVRRWFAGSSTIPTASCGSPCVVRPGARRLPATPVVDHRVVDDGRERFEPRSPGRRERQRSAARPMQRRPPTPASVLRRRAAPRPDGAAVGPVESGSRHPQPAGSAVDVGPVQRAAWNVTQLVGGRGAPSPGPARTSGTWPAERPPPRRAPRRRR